MRATIGTLRMMLLGSLLVSRVLAQQTPSADVIAWVGQSPLHVSEINLLMHRRQLTPTDLSANANLRSALTHVLIRRQFAYQTLLEQSGESGQARVQQAVDDWAGQVLATGKSLEEYAIEHRADIAAMHAEVGWLTLWNDYLQVRLTAENLQRFFQTRAYLYDGTQAEVSQIFISDTDRLEALQQIAEKIRDRQATFADSARRHSQAGSAADGGRLGWIGADGDVPIEVAMTALSAQADSMLPIVRTSLGLHLIYVHAKRPGKLGFSELSDHRRLRRDAADFLFDHLVEQGKMGRTVRCQCPICDH